MRPRQQQLRAFSLKAEAADQQRLRLVPVAQQRLVLALQPILAATVALERRQQIKAVLAAAGRLDPEVTAVPVVVPQPELLVLAAAALAAAVLEQTVLQARREVEPLAAQAVIMLPVLVVERWGRAAPSVVVVVVVVAHPVQ
jgi:hypothetical protein